MRRVYLAFALCALCLLAFGQSLAANQVRINGRTFTIGTNAYDTDYNVVFNQWYKGHKSAEEAKQGEDLS
jgi:peptide deformylase